MAETPIKSFLDTLFHFVVFEAKGVCEQGAKGRGVWWISREGDWYRPCWITVSEYSAGCIRVRNDTNPGLPKAKWPLELPDNGGPHKFELTFHESELTKETAQLIFSCCSDPKFKFSSPFFKEEGDIPHYAWTLKAKEHYEKRRRPE